jgi:general secretion pathway protein A
MYLDHYGLREPPFSITPDPRFVFLSDRHRDALAHLVYGISQGGGGGFIQLTGEVGTGKTTLSRLLLEQLPENTRVALVLNPLLSPVELLEAIALELHLDIDGARGSSRALVELLNRHLLKAHADGLRVVLMLDEAQQLSVPALEQVRLLTNLETATQKLLQIVLLGQPELREVLARPELRQLAQRITARYHLTPLDRDETAAYVRHRLAIAGCARGPFGERALRVLHARAGGVPRLINVIAERALVIGYARDARQIDAGMVAAAASEVLGGSGDAAPATRLAPALLAGLALAAVLAVTLAAWWLGRSAAPAPARDADAGAAAAPAPGLDDVLAAAAPALAAETALLTVWQAPAALAARIPACPFRLGRGLHCVRSRGTLAQLAALDRPVLLTVPTAAGGRPVALLGLDDGQARIDAGGGPLMVARAELEAAWPGEYLALLMLPTAVEPVWPGRLPEWAQAALAGFEMNRSLPPLSDQDERIRRLQQALGLRSDGITGPETWWVLSAHLDGGPRLAAGNR